MDKEFQDRVDTLVKRVYGHGGAINATCDHASDYKISILNLPGILTKSESLEDAIMRFEQWEREK